MDDVYEIEKLEGYEDIRSPLEMAEDKFNNIYKRDWKLYLNSIEWDTWCEKIEKEVKPLVIKEVHPFEKFF